MRITYEAYSLIYVFSGIVVSLVVLLLLSVLAHCSTACVIFFKDKSKGHQEAATYLLHAMFHASLLLFVVHECQSLPCALRGIADSIVSLPSHSVLGDIGGSIRQGFLLSLIVHDDSVVALPLSRTDGRTTASSIIAVGGLLLSLVVACAGTQALHITL